MRRPKVISNFAITADGKISTRQRTRSGFTSSRDRRRLVEIRALGDAVLVARGTAETDDNALSIAATDLRAARLARGQAAQPRRVVISNSGAIPATLKVFSRSPEKTLVFSTQAMTDSQRRALEPRAELRLFLEKNVPLGGMLQELRTRHGVRTLICEGGPQLLKALLLENLLDEMFITIAPKIFGGKEAPGMTGLPGPFFPETRHFRLKTFFVENDEAYCHYVRKAAR